MRLFFDARYIRTDFHDGISRYTTELGNALARLTSVTFILSDRAQLKHLPSGAEHIIIHAITSIKEPFTSLVLNKYKPDVVISPLQTMGSLGRRFKLVLTLHDLIYYKHRTPPPQYSRALRLGWRLYHSSYIPGRLVLNNADLIVTVSETSKQEILDANLTKRPIIVVSNAARDLSHFLEKTPQAISKPKNLIYMGSFIPYKNVETLIKAMGFLPGRTLHLLSRINPERKTQLQKLIPKHANVVFHGGVSDKEYANLLANDAVMVSASKAEGYGLPLAEALVMGVPAVVSDLDIFREVGGDGALFTNPDDPKSFAEHISKLDNKKLRDELIEKGRQHIKKFDWNSSAKNLLDNIERL